MTRKPRKIPSINSSSSADIAFLLLIFFLVTTSMGAEKGILRRLAPLDNENAPVEQIKIKQRNILVLYIDANNKIMANGKPIDLSQVQSTVETFVENPDNDPDLPEKFSQSFPFIGDFPITKYHTISLQTHKDTRYETYLSLQNQLSAAYNQLRSQLSQKYFAQPFEALSQEKQEVVKSVYPYRIAELETHNGERREK